MSDTLRMSAVIERPKRRRAFLGKFPRFTQIMGECESREWVTRIPGYTGDDGSDLWVLLRVRQVNEVGEPDEYWAELFECYSSVDWTDPSSWNELTVELTFGIHGSPSQHFDGTSALVLFYEVAQYVALSY